MTDTTNGRDDEQVWVPYDSRGRLARRDARLHVRHCIHFATEGDPAEYDADMAKLRAGEGEAKSYPRLATPEQLRTLKRCQTCSTVDNRPTLVETCPVCYMELPVTGICGNCG